jgi:hypothetical protein
MASRISEGELQQCGPNNAFIAVAAQAGLDFRTIFQLSAQKRYTDFKKVIIAAIRSDRVLIPSSVRLYDPPLPPRSGFTGETLASLHMQIHVKNLTMDKQIVLLCHLKTGCPYGDNSLPYTLLITRMLAADQYRPPVQKQKPVGRKKRHVRAS